MKIVGKCSVPTKKGKQCKIPADRRLEGQWYCHLHDPLGKYQIQHGFWD